LTSVCRHRTPIVPRQKRKGVTERIDSKGKVELALDAREVREAARQLKALNVESGRHLFSVLVPKSGARNSRP